METINGLLHAYTLIYIRNYEHTHALVVFIHVLFSYVYNTNVLYYNYVDAVPEYKIFKDHYHGLTKLLFNTNLTPHLIQEGIIAPADQEKLSAIDTSAGKAEMVLPKITSALEAGITDSFYKMLGIMRSYGNHDAQQLSITMKHEIAGSKNDKGCFDSILSYCS